MNRCPNAKLLMPMTLPPSIAEFLKSRRVLTLATSQGGIPHCANVFYAFLENEPCLVFSSQSHTLHIRQALANSRAAGSVFADPSSIGKICGVQMTGIVRRPADALGQAARRAYLLRFPYAVAVPAPLWVFEPDWIKFTDNRLGFGVKKVWERPPACD